MESDIKCRYKHKRNQLQNSYQIYLSKLKNRFVTAAYLANNMTQTCYVKYGTLSGLLLLCTIVLSMTENNQSSVFAQITPAPEKFGGSDDEGSTNSPSHTHGSNSNDGASGSSSSNEDDDGSDGEGQDITSSDNQKETAEEDSTDTSGTNDSNDGQSTPDEQSDEATSTEDVDTDDTNPLVEAIMNEVNEVLSASGITGSGF
jgi:hypothetical protein